MLIESVCISLSCRRFSLMCQSESLTQSTEYAVFQPSEKKFGVYSRYAASGDMLDGVILQYPVLYTGRTDCKISAQRGQGIFNLLS